MGIQDWGWMIGGGLYIDDINIALKQKEKVFKQRIIDNIIKTLISFFIFISIIFFIIRRWHNDTQKTFNKMIDFFIEAGEKNIYLREDDIIFNEFQELAVSVNKMIDSREKTQNELNIANEKLREQATRDYMTNLYNRRYFIDISNNIISITKRDKLSLCLIMIDIDDFKKINDTYGHDKGDKVIKLLSGRLNEFVRQSDIVARFGGEEFVILLPNTNKEGAFKLAEEIRKDIESLEIQEGDKTISFTISLGLDRFDIDEDISIDDLVKRADKALYISKRSGKNKTTIFKSR